LRSLNLIPQDVLEKNEQFSCINDETPLILSEKPLASDIAQTYEIIGVAQPNFQEVKKELHRLNCYAFSTKNYHVKLNNFVIDKLSAKKGQPAYLFFVRTENGVRCLIAQRLTQEKTVEG